MQLYINDGTNSLKCSRFGNSPTIISEEPLKIETDNTTITINKIDSSTWEQSYTQLVNTCANRLQQWFMKYRSNYIWTINTIAPCDGAFTLLPGRYYKFTFNHHGISLGKVVIDNSLSREEVYDIISRFIMCIYHFLNNLNRRLLNPEPPYGILHRYMSAQACYNLIIFNTNFVVNAFASMDAVVIVLGYINKVCEPLSVKFSVDINAEGKTGLLGIYLDTASATVDPNSYRITRNFVSAEGKDFGETDITNPNDCTWQFGGQWTHGTIQQTFNLGKSAKSTYLITKNPYVNRYTRYSDSGRCVFNITVNAQVTQGNKVIDSRKFNFTCDCAELVAGKEKVEVTDQEEEEV